jgi:hypothetical protein
VKWKGLEKKILWATSRLYSTICRDRLKKPIKIFATTPRCLNKSDLSINLPNLLLSELQLEQRFKLPIRRRKSHT